MTALVCNTHLHLTTRHDSHALRVQDNIVLIIASIDKVSMCATEHTVEI